MPRVGFKSCINCKKEKPLDEFNKDRSRKDGFHPYCKKCKSEIGVFLNEH